MTLEQLAEAAKAWMQQMMKEAEDYDVQSQGVDHIVSGNAAVLRAESFARGLAVQKMREFLTECGLMDGGALERETELAAEKKSRMEHINAVKQGLEPPHPEIVRDDRLFAELQQTWNLKFAPAYNEKMQARDGINRPHPRPVLGADGQPYEVPVPKPSSDVDALRDRVDKLTQLLEQVLGQNG